MRHSLIFFSIPSRRLLYFSIRLFDDDDVGFLRAKTSMYWVEDLKVRWVGVQHARIRPDAVVGGKEGCRRAADGD